MTAPKYILAAALFAICQAFTASIAASRQKCFTLVATEAQKLYGSYSVHFGGAMDINVLVTDPEKNMIYDEESLLVVKLSFHNQISHISIDDPAPWSAFRELRSELA